jgi:hypothetical protein
MDKLVLALLVVMTASPAFAETNEQIQRDMNRQLQHEIERSQDRIAAQQAAQQAQNAAAANARYYANQQSNYMLLASHSILTL